MQLKVNGRALPWLGAGIGYRASLRAELFLAQQSVDFLELTIEHFADLSAEQSRELSLLQRHFPLLLHGLDLSLGSAEGIDDAHLAKVARLVALVDPPWWSEHISFTQSDGIQVGHLSPLPYTEEAVDVLARNVARVRERIVTPLVLENITYPLAMPGGTMTEAAFLRRVLDRTGCGLLLDVTNVYTNAMNHGFDAREFLLSLPLERVVQLHVAGGFWEDGLLVDSHSRPTPDEVWELVDVVVQRADVKAVLIERDERIPPLRELVHEVERARQILGQRVA